MDLDLAGLRAFVAVAEELHFGRAALRLSVSQPQVSRQVRALEQTLGVQLFVRTARRTELTDAGAALLDDALEVLAVAERLHSKAVAQRRGTRESALFDRYMAAARELGAAHGTVTLLVSHRFSTVRGADLIVVLDEGRVAETGTHQELMAAGGVYAELFQLQASAYH